MSQIKSEVKSLISKLLNLPPADLSKLKIVVHEDGKVAFVTYIPNRTPGLLSINVVPNASLSSIHGMVISLEEERIVLNPPGFTPTIVSSAKDITSAGEGAVNIKSGKESYHVKNARFRIHHDGGFYYKTKVGGKVYTSTFGGLDGGTRWGSSPTFNELYRSLEGPSDEELFSGIESGAYGFIIIHKSILSTSRIPLGVSGNKDGFLVCVEAPPSPTISFVDNPTAISSGGIVDGRSFMDLPAAIEFLEHGWWPTTASPVDSRVSTGESIIVFDEDVPSFKIRPPSALFRIEMRSDISSVAAGLYKSMGLDRKLTPKGGSYVHIDKMPGIMPLFDVDGITLPEVATQIYANGTVTLPSLYDKYGDSLFKEGSPLMSKKKRRMIYAVNYLLSIPICHIEAVLKAFEEFNNPGPMKSWVEKLAWDGFVFGLTKAHLNKKERSKHGVDINTLILIRNAAYRAERKMKKGKGRSAEYNEKDFSNALKEEMRDTDPFLFFRINENRKKIHHVIALMLMSIGEGKDKLPEFARKIISGAPPTLPRDYYRAKLKELKVEDLIKLIPFLRSGEKKKG